MTILFVFLGLIICYLLGSIPSAYIMGKFYKGIDIREHGSGNVGATNVFRVLGKKPGIVVLLADALKGVLAVALVPDIFGFDYVDIRILMAFAVVAGHNWTIFLNFKGGKGVATSLGVLIGLTIKIASIRIVLLFTVLTWVVCFLVTAIVSISSIISSIFLPIIMVLTGQSIELVSLGVIFCVFVVFRHRANIKRLFEGKESKVKLPFHGGKKT